MSAADPDAPLHLATVLSVGVKDADGLPMIDVSDRPWSGVTRADYASAVEYCAACVIDENSLGSRKTKSRCKLPVYEPGRLGGALNRHAVHAAANRLVRARGGVEADAAVKRSAALRLLQLYNEIGETPPASLNALAGRAIGQRDRGITTSARSDVVAL